MGAELGTHLQIINAGFLAKRDTNYYCIQVLISHFYIKKLKKVAKSLPGFFSFQRQNYLSAMSSLKTGLGFSSSDPHLATWIKIILSKTSERSWCFQLILKSTLFMRKLKVTLEKKKLWVGIQYSFFNLYFLEINFSFMSQKYAVI